MAAISGSTARPISFRKLNIGWDPVITLLVVLFLAFFTGAGIGFFGPLAGALVVGGVAAVITLFVPMQWAMWALFVLVFLVVGQLQYFGIFGKAFWIPYLLGAIILVRIPFDLINARSQFASSAAPASATLFNIGLAFYLSIVLFATVVNAPPLLQVFVSIKEYLFLWSVFFVFALGLVPTNFMREVWIKLLWLAPLQVPMVLYQRFIVVPGRKGSSAWDAVVGLFGGDPEGGGASAAMALFSIFAILLALSLHRAGVIRARFLVLVVVSALISIAAAEVKIAIFALPIGFLLFYRRDLLRKPIRSSAVLLLVAGLSIGLLFVYQKQFAPQNTAAGRSLEAYVLQMMERTADTGYFVYERGQMNRVTALRYWWDQNSLAEPMAALLGHGIGSSRTGRVVVGEEARRHIYRIDNTSATIFLWEIGFLGTIATVALFVSAAYLAVLVSRNRRLAEVDRCISAAIFPMLLIYLLAIPYNSDFANGPASQTLTLLMFGFVVFHHSRLMPALRGGAVTGS